MPKIVDHDARRRELVEIASQVIAKNGVEGATLRELAAEAGFSNGAGMAEHVALHRRVAAAVLFSGALPLDILGARLWPAEVPVQLHYGVSDPNRNQDWVDQFLAAVRASGGGTEFHEYAVSVHLFTDASRTDEFDPEATEMLWNHVHDFLRKLPR